MRAVNSVVLLLIIIGGLNWGLVGAFDFNLVDTLFGEGSALSRIVYIVVGLAALYELIPWVMGLMNEEDGTAV